MFELDTMIGIIVQMYKTRLFLLQDIWFTLPAFITLVESQQLEFLLLFWTPV